MNVLRGMRYMATEVAHGVLDVVEHVVTVWAPLPIQARTSLDVREEFEECLEPGFADTDDVWGSLESDGPDISKASPAASAGHVGVGGEAVSGPPIPPASPHLNLTQWLEPAVCEALAEHTPEVEPCTGKVVCADGVVSHGVFEDLADWREHVAADLSEHVVVSLSALWGIRL